MHLEQQTELPDYRQGRLAFIAATFASGYASVSSAVPQVDTSYHLAMWTGGEYELTRRSEGDALCSLAPLRAMDLSVAFDLSG